MKIAISVPVDVLRDANRLAIVLGVSRSEICARALRAFLETFDEIETTKTLDRVYGAEPSRLDPAWQRMQSARLRASF